MVWSSVHVERPRTSTSGGQSSGTARVVRNYSSRACHSVRVSRSVEVAVADGGEPPDLSVGGVVCADFLAQSRKLVHERHLSTSDVSRHLPDVGWRATHGLPFLSNTTSPLGKVFLVGPDSSWSDRAFSEDGFRVSFSWGGRDSSILNWRSRRNSRWCGFAVAICRVTTNTAENSYLFVMPVHVRTAAGV